MSFETFQPATPKGETKAKPNKPEHQPPAQDVIQHEDPVQADATDDTNEYVQFMKLHAALDAIPKRQRLKMLEALRKLSA